MVLCLGYSSRGSILPEVVSSLPKGPSTLSCNAMQLFVASRCIRCEWSARKSLYIYITILSASIYLCMCAPVELTASILQPTLNSHHMQGRFLVFVSVWDYIVYFHTWTKKRPCMWWELRVGCRIDSVSSTGAHIHRYIDTVRMVIYIYKLFLADHPHLMQRDEKLHRVARECGWSLSQCPK